ncbi:Maf-like protein [Limtongia smithiae]|uniref:Maf-like protein n=1 Tax=Limtongia smithiae TaxID=1125753 RepID=UPI0034CE28A8
MSTATTTTPSTRPGVRPPPRMLKLPVFEFLKGKHVVLASSSPRRRELLRQIGITDFKVVKPKFEEDLDKSRLTVTEYVNETATAKALEVYSREVEADNDPALVIAADTVVLLGDSILEKPKSAKDHFQMLQRLRDEKLPHKVYTSVVCIAPLREPVYPGYSMYRDFEETQVVFDSEVSDDFLAAYVASGEARDAAGGYCVQEKGALMVEKIIGDYNNVVGLPLRLLLKLMEKVLIEDDEEPFQLEN